MKSILVPTDFSDCAGYATDAAVQLAKRFNAKVYLLNSQNLPPYWDNLPEEEKSKWVKVNQGIETAANLLKELKDKYPNIQFETSATSKSLPDAVAECVEKHGN